MGSGFFVVMGFTGRECSLKLQAQHHIPVAHFGWLGNAVYDQRDDGTLLVEGSKAYGWLAELGCVP